MIQASMAASEHPFDRSYELHARAKRVIAGDPATAFRAYDDRAADGGVGDGIAPD